MPARALPRPSPEPLRVSRFVALKLRSDSSGPQVAARQWTLVQRCRPRRSPNHMHAIASQTSRRTRPSSRTFAPGVRAGPELRWRGRLRRSQHRREEADHPYPRGDGERLRQRSGDPTCVAAKTRASTSASGRRQRSHDFSFEAAPVWPVTKRSVPTGRRSETKDRVVEERAKRASRNPQPSGAGRGATYGAWSRLSARCARCSTTCGDGDRRRTVKPLARPPRAKPCNLADAMVRPRRPGPLGDLRRSDHKRLEGVWSASAVVPIERKDRGGHPTGRRDLDEDRMWCRRRGLAR